MVVITNTEYSNIFVLSNNVKIELKKDKPFIISNSNYKRLLDEYGDFFRARIIKDGNKIGCFRVEETEEDKDIKGELKTKKSKQKIQN